MNQKIHAHTDDYCAIETINIMETILKMTMAGWTLIEHIPDDEGGIEKSLLCFGKGGWWN